MCANPEFMKIYNAVREVPKEALKPISAGRLKGMSDINPMWRIKMLTEQFGPCGFGWYIDEIERWAETGRPVMAGDGRLIGNEIACFVKIHLFVKLGEEWSKPIVGIGGATFMPFEKNGFYTDDECYKKAYTDAISIACKALGFAADIYYQKDPTKYDARDEQSPQKPAQQPTVDPNALPFPKAVGAASHTLPPPPNPVNFAQKPQNTVNPTENTDLAKKREWAKNYALPRNTEYPGIKLGDLYKMNRDYFMSLLKNPPDTETHDAASVLYDWINANRVKAS